MVRVRKNSSIEDLYLQKDGTWGDWKTAKKFSTDSAAEKYAARLGIEVFGLF